MLLESIDCVQQRHIPRHTFLAVPKSITPISPPCAVTDGFTNGEGGETIDSREQHMSVGADDRCCSPSFCSQARRACTYVHGPNSCGNRYTCHVQEVSRRLRTCPSTDRGGESHCSVSVRVRLSTYVCVPCSYACLFNKSILPFSFTVPRRSSLGLAPSTAHP